MLSMRQDKPDPKVSDTGSGHGTDRRRIHDGYATDTEHTPRGLCVSVVRQVGKVKKLHAALTGELPIRPHRNAQHNR